MPHSNVGLYTLAIPEASADRTVGRGTNDLDFFPVHIGVDDINQKPAKPRTLAHRALMRTSVRV
jgi:hypothetical protein